jgi:serine/threonine-protein kinase SRPK3
MVLILSASAQHVNVEVILREAPSSPGSRHIEQLLDDFHHTGPNGTHVCLVLEVLGPNIPTVIEERYSAGRLPADIACSVAWQVALTIGFLHKNNVAHGGKLSLIFFTYCVNSSNQRQC